MSSDLIKYLADAALDWAVLLLGLLTLLGVPQLLEKLL